MSNQTTPQSVKKKVNSSSLFSTPNSLVSSSSKIKPALLKKVAAFEQSKTTDLNSAFSINRPTIASAGKTPIKTLVKAKSSNAINVVTTPTALPRSFAKSPAPRSLLSTPKSLKKPLPVGPQTPECFTKVSLGTPKRMAKSSIDLSSTKDRSAGEDIGEISNLKVAVRVRPMNAKECKNSAVKNVIRVKENEITVLANSSADNFGQTHHSFQYDNAFWSCDSDHPDCADQTAIFEGTALPLVDKAFEGYNTCLFAYGQTGSGKSYSMMGIDLDDNDINAKTNSEAGIIPRFCQEIFNRIKRLKNEMHAEVEVSYFEIYNEKIHDLLTVAVPSSGSDNGASSNHGNVKKPALKVREHPIWGPYVVDLSTHPVDSHAALRNWLAVGNSQRATFSTGMNDKSSRSHSIFSIILNLSDITTDGNGVKIVNQTKRSKISLIDLAGSERLSHTCASGERLKEGVSINKSLLTLGKVIAALADTTRKPTGFVPYRESVLTWLLRENLGGNSRTVMLATISPASQHLDETLATLRYACQARTIVNRVKVNEDPHDRIIRELRAEVERLQALRQDYERQKRHSGNAATPRKIIIETSTDDTEVEALRQQLLETEHELATAQRSWMDRLQEAEEVRKTEMRLLKRKGLALELSAEQKYPCLVNLAADPILSGTLLYILPPGLVKVGRPSSFSQPDIVLEGPLVSHNHCTIENNNNSLFLTPEDTEEYDTFVNGEIVTSRCQLYHCDRLVIGGSHYFRISNPNCSQRLKNATTIIDFQIAHQEVMLEQEKRLREELNAEKEAALEQIEEERIANERDYERKMASLEMQKFTYKCNREVLQAEQQVLNQTRLEQEEKEDKFEFTPYKSTLLDDIKRIMEHPTQESLHQTQLMVKEATRRCKNVGIEYEFKQTQVADEFGIFHAVVNIVDREHQRVAEWPPARLDVWLSIIRENDENSLTPEHMFDCVDLQWQEGKSLDESIFAGNLNESFNSTSRISLNMNAMKDAIFGRRQSQQRQSLLTNCLKSNMESLKHVFQSPCAPNNSPSKKKPPPHFNDKENDKTSVNRALVSPNASLLPHTSFETRASAYLKDIQGATLKLRRLCQKYQHLEENSSPVNTSLISPTNKYTNVENRLELTKALLASINEIENSLDDVKLKLDENETKISIRTPKTVRFLVD